MRERETGAPGAETVSRAVQGPGPREGSTQLAASQKRALRNLEGPPAACSLLPQASPSQLFWKLPTPFPWGGGSPLFDPRMSGEPEWGHSTLFSVKILCESSVSGTKQCRHCSLFPAPGFPPKRPSACSQHTVATPVPGLSSCFTFLSWAGLLGPPTVETSVQ